MAKAKPRRKTSRRKSKVKNRRIFRKLIIAAVALTLIGLLVLDILVIKQFAGSKWQVPSHVYSRPLEIYRGLPFNREQVIWELQALGYRRVASATASGQFSVARNKLDIFTRGFAFWDQPEPSRRILITFAGNTVSELRSASGEELSLVRLEPNIIGGIYPSHREDRELVKLSAVPMTLRMGLVAVEDHNFYRHHGISLRAIARALLANIREAGIVQGGSTLTQQLVKNFYLDERRTLARKALEAVMALMLELHFSKDEILEGYLNEVYLGQAGSLSIHGFGLASRHYFGMPLDRLALHQQALLIGMVKGAAYYNPRRNPERARARRNLVLDKMAEEGVASPREVARAKTRSLDLAAGRVAGNYPAYLDLVKRQLREDYREQDLRSAGLRIFTNFDPQAQRLLEKSVSDGLSAIERDYKVSPNSLQAGAAVVRVGTGEVIALLGDRQPGYPGFNRALDARRPVGSTIKTAVYLAALENTYTLASPLDDSEIRITTDDGQVWQPRNFERLSHGRVPLYEAFGQSYNQATARLGMAVGLPSVIDVLQRLGFERSVREVPSLLLGSVGMSVFEVATLYHTVATGGYRARLRSIDAVYTVDNELLRRYPYQVEQQFSPQVMHLLQYGLQVVMREGTGKSAYWRLPQELVVAGKTGTSNGQRDSWFSGFSGDYLNVVWLGRDDNGKMPVTGGTGALRIWGSFMASLPQSSFLFAKPERVSYHWIDTEHGILTGRGCHAARELPFIDGTEPTGHSGCRGGSLKNFTDWLKNTLGIE